MDLAARAWPASLPSTMGSDQMPDSEASFDDAFHKSIVDNIADGVYYVDLERRITYWNHGAERLTGYAAKDMIGEHCFANRLSHVDAAGTALCFEGCPLQATMGDGEVREAEVWMRHESGHRSPVRVRTAPVRDAAGEIIGAVEVFDDASRLIEAREHLATARHDAMTDTLTLLPNRRHFDAALDGRLDNLRRYGWAFGLLIADIDHFKRVNDRYGHDVGDAALATVAASIAGGVRHGDLAARWGGEEFAILVEATDESSLLQTAERLRILVAHSVVKHGDARFGVRISIGGSGAMATDGAHDLIGRADAALYRAKDTGRDRVVLVSAEPTTTERPERARG